MPYVITEKCLDERYAQCVGVCPVDCIHPIDHNGKPFMVIDPDTCIECGACLPVCPINAIVASVDEDPAYAKVNKDLTPASLGNPAVAVRPASDPPRRADNKIVQ